MKNIPEATLVFDHFHVVKLMNDALDEIRRSVYREEKDLNKRKVFKGTRWLLLCNGKDIFDNQFKSRLDNALKLNEPLMKAYYLKEGLKEIWTQVNKERQQSNILKLLRNILLKL
jgi:transposase